MGQPISTLHPPDLDGHRVHLHGETDAETLHASLFFVVHAVESGVGCSDGVVVDAVDDGSVTREGMHASAARRVMGDGGLPPATTAPVW